MLAVHASRLGGREKRKKKKTRGRNSPRGGARELEKEAEEKRGSHRGVYIVPKRSSPRLALQVQARATRVYSGDDVENVHFVTGHSAGCRANARKLIQNPGSLSLSLWFSRD